MASLDDINLHHQTHINATRFSTDLNKQFENYLNSKFPYLTQLESYLKFHFKNLEEEEETNVFFELETSELLHEINNTIFVDEFSVANDEEKVTEILNQMANAINGNVKNNKIMLKALENIHLIINFFDSLKTNLTEAKELLAEGEKTFDLVNTPQNLKSSLNQAQDICTRMIKAVSKVKKTQVTFTINDEVLSSLVENLEGGDVTLQEVMQNFDSCNVFFERLEEELDFLLEQDLTVHNDEIDSKVRNVTNLFAKFLENPNNHLFMFLTQCYVYRDTIINDLTDQASAFATLLLKKVTCYRTFVFLKYFDDYLDEELARGIKKMGQQISGFFDTRSPLQEFTAITAQASKTSILIYFIKNALVDKKTDAIIFNNHYLNEKVPELVQKIDRLSQSLATIEEELRIIQAIVPAYDQYIEATNQMKLINLKTDEPNERVNIQRSLRCFRSESDKLEYLLYDYRGWKSSAYRQIRDVLDGNYMIAQEYKTLFMQRQK